MIVSGCTLALLTRLLNGGTRHKLLWTMHLDLQRLNELYVHLSIVQTVKRQKKRRPWENISSMMDLCQTYTRWTCLGEAEHVRDEFVRQCIKDFADEARVGPACWMTMMKHASMKELWRMSRGKLPAYYNTLSAAQKPIHDNTRVLQLDTTARLMAIKSKFSHSK